MHSVSIPFELRGVPGSVHVSYQRNEDPRRWGYHVLGLDYAIERARGCPVISATVAYDAEGYAAALGWIQVVRLSSPEAGEPAELVDVAPQMSGAGVPWLSWGTRPRYFDAPSASYQELKFHADAFLAFTPDALMSPVAEPLCGFSWEYELRGGKPLLGALQPAGRDRWAAMQPVLAGHCPDWTFRDLPDAGGSRSPAPVPGHPRVEPTPGLTPG